MLKYIFLVVLLLLSTTASAKVYDVSWSISGSKVDVNYDGMKIEFFNMTSVPTLNKAFFVMNKTNKVIAVNSLAINLNQYFKPQVFLDDYRYVIVNKSNVVTNISLNGFDPGTYCGVNASGGANCSYTFGISKKLQNRSFIAMIHFPGCEEGKYYDLIKSNSFLESVFSGSVVDRTFCLNNKTSYYINGFSSYIINQSSQGAAGTSSLATFLVNAWDGDGASCGDNRKNTNPLANMTGNNGAICVAQGKSGNAFNMSKSSTRAWNSTNLGAVVGANNRTLCFWLNLTRSGAGTYDRSVGYGSSQSGTNYEVYRSQTQYAFTDANNFATIPNSYATANLWTHFCLVYNSTHVIYYMNATNMGNLATTLSGTVRNLRLGYAPDAPSNTDNAIGMADEIYVFNNTITAAEVGYLYNNSVGCPYSSCITLAGGITYTNYSLEQWTSINASNTTLLYWYNASGIIYSNITLTSPNVSLWINNTMVGQSQLAIVANNFTKYHWDPWSIARNLNSTNLKVELRLNSTEINNSDYIYVPFASNISSGACSTCVLTNLFISPTCNAYQTTATTTEIR